MMVISPQEKSLTDLVLFFYPSGYWGGYAKFFDPPLPNRLGGRFIDDVVDVIKKGDFTAFFRARQTLTSTHIKNGKNKNDKLQECIPTPEASVALAKLQAILAWHLEN